MFYKAENKIHFIITNRFLNIPVFMLKIIVYVHNIYILYIEKKNPLRKTKP